MYSKVLEEKKKIRFMVGWTTVSHRKDRRTALLRYWLDNGIGRL